MSAIAQRMVMRIGSEGSPNRAGKRRPRRGYRAFAWGVFVALSLAIAVAPAAFADLTLLALELKAYRAERGEYPASLQELVATGVDLPVDPLSGMGYQYQRTAAGFRLWSYGEDLDDDGGVPWARVPRPGDGDLVWEATR